MEVYLTGTFLQQSFVECITINEHVCTILKKVLSRFGETGIIVSAVNVKYYTGAVRAALDFLRCPYKQYQQHSILP